MYPSMVKAFQDWIGGGGGEPKKPSLSYDQINKWSDFVEKNPKLNSFSGLWGGFSKLNPKSGINPQILQSDLEMLNAGTRGQAKKNNSAFTESAHTGYIFPKMIFNGQDYGRVNALMQTQNPIPTPTTSYPEKLIAKQLPDGVENLWFDDTKGLVAYEDPTDGDIKYARKETLNSEQAKKLNKK